MKLENYYLHEKGFFKISNSLSEICWTPNGLSLNDLSTDELSTHDLSTDGPSGLSPSEVQNTTHWLRYNDIFFSVYLVPTKITSFQVTSLSKRQQMSKNLILIWNIIEALTFFAF